LETLSEQNHDWNLERKSIVSRQYLLKKHASSRATYSEDDTPLFCRLVLTISE